MWGKVGGYWSNSSQGGLFSLHSLGDTYQESYQSYEVIRYDSYTDYKSTGEYCGHIAYKGKLTWPSGHVEWPRVPSKATTDSSSLCPGKVWGPYGWPMPGNGSAQVDNAYTAICNSGYGGHSDFYSSGHYYTCPKGWGKGWRFKGTAWTVGCNNGEKYKGTIKNNPVYGYVTRYRDVYYNYITGRVSKA